MSKIRTNLQLFAEDEEKDLELPEEYDLDDGYSLDIDFGEEDETLTEEVEPPAEEKPQQSKNGNEAIKKAVIAERRKWQKRIEELENKINSSKTTTTEDADTDEFYNSLLDAGYDEKFIKVLKSNINKTSKKTETLENIIKQKFRDMEFKELTKDPNFSDADLYRDDIEKFMDKTGLNAEQAYLALYGKSKLLKNKSDIEREAEQRVINNYKKKENIVIDTTDTGKQMTDKVKGKLTNDEIEIAKAAGMTPQEYYALKNSKTIEQINKVLKKKG